MPSLLPSSSSNLDAFRLSAHGQRGLGRNGNTNGAGLYSIGLGDDDDDDDIIDRMQQDHLADQEESIATTSIANTSMLPVVEDDDADGRLDITVDSAIDDGIGGLGNGAAAGAGSSPLRMRHLLGSEAGDDDGDGDDDMPEMARNGSGVGVGVGDKGKSEKVRSASPANTNGSNTSDSSNDDMDDDNNNNNNNKDDEEDEYDNETDDAKRGIGNGGGAISKRRYVLCCLVVLAAIGAVVGGIVAYRGRSGDASLANDGVGVGGFGAGEGGNSSRPISSDDGSDGYDDNGVNDVDDEKNELGSFSTPTLSPTTPKMTSIPTTSPNPTTFTREPTMSASPTTDVPTLLPTKQEKDEQETTLTTATTTTGDAVFAALSDLVQSTSSSSSSSSSSSATANDGPRRAALAWMVEQDGYFDENTDAAGEGGLARAMESGNDGTITEIKTRYAVAALGMALDVNKMFSSDATKRRIRGTTREKEQHLRRKMQNGETSSGYANGWFTSASICQWEGITCALTTTTTTTMTANSITSSSNNFTMSYVPTASPEAVTEIRLPRLGLNGYIPPEIGAFSSTLTYLDLAENNLGGTIPDALYTCRELIGLYLENNLLTGGLKDDIGQLSKMRGMYLGNNMLSGTLSKKIIKMKDTLRYLSLHSNRFSGPFPDLALRVLFYLDISYNQFDGLLPLDLGSKYRNLQVVYLDHNRFVGPIPYDYIYIGQRKLYELHLNDNRLCGGVPQGFDKLWDYNRYLFGITVHNNRLTQALDDGTCKLSVLVGTGELIEMGTDCSICQCKDADALCNIDGRCYSGYDFNATEAEDECVEYSAVVAAYKAEESANDGAVQGGAGGGAGGAGAGGGDKAAGGGAGAGGGGGAGAGAGAGGGAGAGAAGKDDKGGGKR